MYEWGTAKRTWRDGREEKNHAAGEAGDQTQAGLASWIAKSGQFGRMVSFK